VKRTSDTRALSGENLSRDIWGMSLPPIRPEQLAALPPEFQAISPARAD
jgi:hypothetical protein